MKTGKDNQNIIRAWNKLSLVRIVTAVNIIQWQLQHKLERGSSGTTAQTDFFFVGLSEKLGKSAQIKIISLKYWLQWKRSAKDDGHTSADGHCSSQFFLLCLTATEKKLWNCHMSMMTLSHCHTVKLMILLCHYFFVLSLQSQIFAMTVIKTE